MRKFLPLYLLLFSLVYACGSESNTDTTETNEEVAGQDSVAVNSFGTTPEGEAKLFTLTNGNGMEVDITNYGGIVTSIRVPDREGNMDDVALGFPTLEGYLGEDPYFGALIGRYGNRIANATFDLNGETYELPANDGPNSLHGGPGGFHTKLWNATQINDGDVSGVELQRTSPAGEEGFPGNLDVMVRYTLTEDNELRIEYEATSDQATPVNLTNHSYFNLSGEGTILDHVLMIDADAFTPVNNTLIPTGELREVAGTPFDFREPTPIGERIEAENEQLGFGQGYDHNWVLNTGGGGLASVATLYDPSSGRMMEVLTTEPGLQFYSGNFLDGSLTGKDGINYELRTGLCLETQHFPDSPNQPEFPSTTLEPGDTYTSETVYRFSTRDENTGN